MKYDSYLQSITPTFASLKNILIALPSDVSIDKLASGLALYLSLQHAGKNVSIVTEGTILVAHSNLFGIGDVKNTLPQMEGGNLVITLKGVVAKDNLGQPSVPSLQKIDWAPNNDDFNLIFTPVPGANFEPSAVIPHKEGGSFDLIFILGSSKLDDLGSVYTSNPQAFSGTQIINIDRNLQNTSFGTVNIVDNLASSFSEMIGQILPSLQLRLDQDIASNLLAGIYGETHNLQDVHVSADTFEVVSAALRAGGQKPASTVEPSPSQSQAVESVEIVSPVQIPEQKPTPQTAGFDFSKLFQSPPPTATPGPINVGSPEHKIDQNVQSSPEEVPSGEKAVTPEDDWLVPKIYRGGSQG